MINLFFSKLKDSMKELNIVFEGDSLTATSSFDSKIENHIVRNYTSSNISTNGANIDNIIDRTSSLIDLHNSEKDNILILWIGTNDASAGINFSTTAFFNKFQSYYDSVKSYFKVIILGLTDLEDLRNYAANIINTYHRFNWRDYADGFADIYLIPECQDHSNTDYFTDGVHHTNALDVLIADYVYYRFKNVII